MKYVLGLGAVALMIVGYAFFWLLSDNELQSAQNEMEDTAEQLEVPSADDAPEAEMNSFGTMNDLRQRGVNLECQITPINNTVTSEGTFFVADNKIRGDFITESPDMEEMAVSSIIVLENTMYVWTELSGESYGVKMPVTAAGADDVPTQEPVGLDERVQYSCQEWSQVDQSVFIPPTDVLFQDLSEVLQSGMEYGTVYEEGEMPY